MSAMPIDLEDIAGQTDSKKFLILSLALNQIQTMVARFQELLVTGKADELSLPERMRNVEKYIDNLKFWGRFIGTAIVLQTITFGAAAVIYFIKLYPLLEKLSKQP